MRGRLLGKNDVLIKEVHVLTDYELIDAFRNSNVMNTYQFSDVITRQAETMEFAQKMESELPGLMQRAGFQCICE